MGRAWALPYIFKMQTINLNSDFLEIKNDFETSLRCFDPNLIIRFHRHRKQWMILEKALIGSGWNIVLDLDTTPGEWVLLKLRAMRDTNELCRRNAKIFENTAKNELQSKQDKLNLASSANHKALFMDRKNDFRRAVRALKNLPTSDVSAGYRKIEVKI